MSFRVNTFPISPPPLTLGKLTVYRLFRKKVYSRAAPFIYINMCVCACSRGEKLCRRARITKRRVAPELFNADFDENVTSFPLRPTTARDYFRLRDSFFTLLRPVRRAVEYIYTYRANSVYLSSKRVSPPPYILFAFPSFSVLSLSLSLSTSPSPRSTRTFSPVLRVTLYTHRKRFERQ